MFKNYLKVAFRSLLTNKIYSIINISGLAIGLTISLLLLLWGYDEWSYDRYNPNANRIYRVLTHVEKNGEIIRAASTPFPLSPALNAEYPWIEKAVRIRKGTDLEIKYEENSYKENVFWADSTIFDIFDITITQGDPATALTEPNCIVISQSISHKFFNTLNPIGKILSIPDLKRDCKVTGVFKDMPHNSHARFDLIGSFNYSSTATEAPGWGSPNFYTYILAKKSFSPETFDSLMPSFCKKYLSEEMLRTWKLTYTLQPLTRIHMEPNVETDIAKASDPNVFYTIFSIAIFILIIACLNYIHLTAAKFTSRSRESALRSVLGATLSQTVNQFIVESYVFVFVAVIPALQLVQALLPMFNALTGKTLTFSDLFHSIFLALIAAVVAVLGLVSGIVPGLLIRKFHPLSALKGMQKTSSMITVMRRIMVVFQFTMAIFFIICTIIVTEQLLYVKNHKIGFNTQNVINIEIGKNKEALRKYETIKQEILQNPDIINTCASSFTPGKPAWNNNYWIEGMTPTQHESIDCMTVDTDFLDTYRIKIIEGRKFSKNFPSDYENAFMINKAAMKLFGWSTAVGQKLKISDGWREKATIIGVVDDFNYNTIHQTIQPLVLYAQTSTYSHLSVRIKPGKAHETVEYLKQKWENILPGTPFDYTFVDEDFNHLYAVEFRVKNLFILAAVLEIFLSCLGLFGLISFSAEKRSKEIGIRKVLGASVKEIIWLIAMEFVQWSIWANVIAWPLAWFAMKQWLQNFAYGITLTVWPFLAAGIIAFIIAFLTVTYKTVQAASIDPVKNLKYE